MEFNADETNISIDKSEADKSVTAPQTTVFDVKVNNNARQRFQTMREVNSMLLQGSKLIKVCQSRSNPH